MTTPTNTYWSPRGFMHTPEQQCIDQERKATMVTKHYNSLHPYCMNNTVTHTDHHGRTPPWQSTMAINQPQLGRTETTEGNRRRTSTEEDCTSPEKSNPLNPQNDVTINQVQHI